MRIEKTPLPRQRLVFSEGRQCTSRGFAALRSASLIARKCLAIDVCLQSNGAVADTAANFHTRDRPPW